MITLFGIKNCDTVRRARRELERAGVAFQFHDFDRDGLSESQIQDWLKQVGPETLINRRGPVWRGLSATEREQLMHGDGAALIAANTRLIKRPVIAHGAGLQVGFPAAEQDAIVTRIRTSS